LGYLFLAAPSLAADFHVQPCARATPDAPHAYNAYDYYH
jgi:hypothetical protein